MDADDMLLLESLYNNFDDLQESQPVHQFDPVPAMVTVTATTSHASSSSSSSLSSSSLGDYELKVLSARIANTDQLVRTIHQQTQEIDNLKTQLVSLNQSVVHVTGTAKADAQRLLQLQTERDQHKRQAEHLAASLRAADNLAVNANSLHTQEIAALEMRCQQSDGELLDVCRQFLVQGNLLSDNRLSDGALNRYYMKVGEMLKRRGQPLDGLLRTTGAVSGSTSRKQQRRLSRGNTIATQTDFAERIVERPPTKQRTCATMTMSKCSAVASTMTDLQADQIVEHRRAKVLMCDRATQALPTTTTRGTSTTTTNTATIGVGTAATKSTSVGTSTDPVPMTATTTTDMGTSCPEPPDVEEILSQSFMRFPNPVSPISNVAIEADDVNGGQNVACQTNSTDDVMTNAVQTQTTGTMTNLANVRKRIEYVKRTPRSQSASAANQKLLQQQQMFDIKKEELISPFGSMQDLSAALDPTMAQPMQHGRTINPQLSGLWGVLGQMLFSIIGSGRIFDDEPSTMEMINRNLSQIRCAIELAAKQTEPSTMDHPSLINALSGDIDVIVKPGYMARNLDQNDGEEQLLNEADNRFVAEFETQTNDDDAIDAMNVCPIVVANDASEMPSTELDIPTIITVNAPSIPIPHVDEPQLNVLSEQIHQQSHTETQSARVAESDNLPSLRTLENSIEPAPQALASVATTSKTDDDAIFKRPTSAVRRLSIRQKAIARKNLSRRTKTLPIIVPPSYSIDRSFKRARRRSVYIPDLNENRRSPKRVPTVQSVSVSAGSPKRKRQRFDDTSIDVNHIAQYFNVPELIERISELDCEQTECTDDIEEYIEKDVAETRNVKKAEKISSILLHDLFGDGDSDEDDVDDGIVGDPVFVGECSSGSASDSETLPAPATSNAHQLPIEFDSPASPPTRCHDDDADDISDPAVIPLCSVQPSVVPVVRDVIRTAYKHDVLKFLRKSNNSLEASNPKLFARLHRILLRYLREDDFTATTVGQCAQHLLQVSDGSRRWLAAVLQETVEDIAGEPLDTTVKPPSSALSSSHQRIVLLVAMLDEQLPGFVSYSKFAIEQTLFTFSGQKPMAGSIVSLVRYFVALDDLRHSAEQSRLRLFLYKCLYYYQQTATPMVYTVLCAVPQCLPAVPDANDAAMAAAAAATASEPDADIAAAIGAVPAGLSAEEATAWTLSAFSGLDPLVQALHVVLANTNYNDAKSGCATVRGDLFRKGELLQMLRKEYKYPAIRHTYAQLLATLMQRIRDGRLHNVANALILVGKRNGCSWTQKHMLDGLKQLLRMYLAAAEESDLNSESTDDVERIECLLHALGSLIKPFPVTEDVADMQTLFASAMVASQNARIQEAAVSALLQTTRFGAINVYRMIADWKPTVTYAISRKLRLQLQTFVHRKPRQFWS